MKTIFVVDDNDTNLSMANKVLKKNYRVMTLPSAERMFALLEKITPDLILLDIEMPNINGFDALRQLKNNNLWSEIPVMFLTGISDEDVEVRGFELGAVDFVIKPFTAPVLLNRINTHLNIDEMIHVRTRKLHRMQTAIVSVLAEMVENRDKGTGGHIERTSQYIKILIDGMKNFNVYSDEVNKWDIDNIISSARMHDLGKISIPDYIINKPDKLTDEEYEIIKTHTTEGERIIDNIITLTGEEDFLGYAKLFAGCHHERWDGTGYPRGLKGEDIPLPGRIMAIVDVYDALVSERPYKKALPHEKAVITIQQNSGTLYDPKITDVFSKVNDLFKEVRS
jgi:putative two-component system response regulator